MVGILPKKKESMGKISWQTKLYNKEHCITYPLYMYSNTTSNIYHTCMECRIGLFELLCFM